jgi:hypothetical protein
MQFLACPAIIRPRVAARGSGGLTGSYLMSQGMALT